MGNCHSELANSVSVEDRQNRSLKPHLALVKSDADRGENFLPDALEDFTFATPPWLLTPNDEFLDVDGVIPVDAIDQLGAHWESHSRNAHATSEKTWVSYKDSLHRLKWFLNVRGFTGCGENELYQFLEYCRIGHKFPGGRWGIPNLTKPLSPRSVAVYYLNLRVFFNWAVKNQFISASPLARIDAPTFKSPTPRPFSSDELDGLFWAAKRSLMPYRNIAMLVFLYDTGLREDEFCNLTYDDINWKQGTAFIPHGKGDKERTIIFGKEAGSVLWNNIIQKSKTPLHYLFVGQRGNALTANGLYLLFKRLGEAASISSTRCSPHTMRHTFASHAIENGASIEEVQRQLGHETDHMTKHYVKLADKFRCERHGNYSPYGRHVRESQMMHHRGRPRRR